MGSWPLSQGAKVVVFTVRVCYIMQELFCVANSSPLPLPTHPTRPQRMVTEAILRGLQTQHPCDSRQQRRAGSDPCHVSKRPLPPTCGRGMGVKGAKVKGGKGTEGTGREGKEAALWFKVFLKLPPWALQVTVGKR